MGTTVPAESNGKPLVDWDNIEQDEEPDEKWEDEDDYEDDDEEAA